MVRSYGDLDAEIIDLRASWPWPSARDRGERVRRTELSFWFGVSGANAEVIENLAKEFNASQTDYRVVPVFKGTYPETLQAGLDAYAAGQPPHIIQVFDVGTGVMMNAEGAFVPVAEVLEKGGGKFDKSQYLPGIVAYYSRPDGTMLSFPFNSSSPILFYNKDIFQARRARRRPAAEDVAGGVADGAADCRHQSRFLRLHLRLAHLDPPGEFRRVEQPALRDERERPRGFRHQAPDQRADLREALRTSLPPSPPTTSFATPAARRRRSSSSCPANAAC